MSEKDLVSPVLEGLEEHAGARSDGADVADAGPTQLETSTDKGGEQVVVPCRDPRVGSPEVGLGFWDRFAEGRILQYRVVPLEHGDDEADCVIGLGGEHPLGRCGGGDVGDSLEA
ncbi:MAG: hypothetical protein M5T61_19205 [Acidimicrobiia bacterium]|nr:hypothetical protein [Acidimicrobiia bacterium]